MRIVRGRSARVVRAWRRRSRSAGHLLPTFVLLLLLPVLGLGAALGQVYRDGADEAALDAARASAQLVAQSSVLPAVDGQDLDLGLDIGGVADLGAVTYAAVREGRLLGLRLLSPDGVVVFPPHEAGLQPSSHTRDAVSATRDGAPPAWLTTSSGPDWLGSEEVPVVEVYAPLVDGRGGRDVGTVVLLLPYEQVAEAADRRAALFVAVLLVGLGLLYAVVVAMAFVVTRRLRLQLTRTHHLAHHDPLTGLPNRTLFRLRADAAVEEGVPAVIAILDLDRFKQVNDTLGHDAGDELLQAVGARLVGAVRTHDTIARLGGDEFGLVLPGLTPADAGPVLDRILHGLHQPLQLGEHLVPVAGSVGVAAFPEDGASVDDLVRHADRAMYEAKRSGTLLAHAGTSDDAAALDELLLGAELDVAMCGDDLLLHYQPLVDLASGRVDCVEALVRWQHPRRGLLSPGDFLPSAEATGQVRDLTRWVLRRALTDIAGCSGAPGVAVNVPPSALVDPRFCDEVHQALVDTGVGPSRLTLEMTETQTVSDVHAVQTTMEQLRALGVGFSLDDFGQGSTSLAFIGVLPFTQVKVDRSFVAALPQHRLQRTIVAAVVAIAHEAGLRVVAEGVETEVVLDCVRALGCDIAQGYLLGRPAPLGELAAVLAPGAAVLVAPVAAARVTT